MVILGVRKNCMSYENINKIVNSEKIILNKIKRNLFTRYEGDSMKFHIITLGCKVNIYESEIIKENLLKNNFSYEEDENNAEILIINTCSVTNMADNKSKKMVRHAKKLNKIIVVCGCSAENKRIDYNELEVDILIGNKDKSKIHEILAKYIETHQKYTKFYDEKELPFEDMTIEKFKSHTRAFVKIQDGCNNFCSYCIIPYVRKNIRSKNFNKTIEEIKTLVKNGHKEIVLTGIHTGSYKDGNHDLGDLLHELRKVENLKRIRISSIEITELNEKMLEEIKTNPKIVDHFHIPLQAGSNEILHRMNRKYDLEYFKKKIQEIRKIKPNVSITTDVIVGHPYETEKLFLETIKTCKEINFSKIHVFPYSKREGTAASRMPMQVEEFEKKRRSRMLNELSKELESDFYKKQINKEVEVLIEEVKENKSTGCTTNYIRVEIPKKLAKNEIYKVVAKEFVNGKIMACPKEKVK